MDTLTQSGALQLADNIRASEIAKTAATPNGSRCECHSCTQTHTFDTYKRTARAEKVLALCQRLADGNQMKAVFSEVGFSSEQVAKNSLKEMRWRYNAESTYHLLAILLRRGEID